MIDDGMTYAFKIWDACDMIHGGQSFFVDYKVMFFHILEI